MCSIDKFIDDMIIFIRTFQDHLLVVEEFLQRFRTANLTAKPSKFHWIQQPRMFGIHCGKPKAETHTRESGSNRELFQTTNKEAFKIVSWFNGLLSEIHPPFFSFSVSIVGFWPRKDNWQSHAERVPAKRIPYVKICTHGDASLEVTLHIHLEDRCVGWSYRSNSSPTLEWHQETSC